MTGQQQKVIETFKCIKCGELASLLPSYNLPKGGRIIRAIHYKNQQEHRWTEFDSIEQFGRQPRKKGLPIRMHCPKCGAIGFVNEHYHPRDKYNLENIQFIFLHEKLPGLWGKGPKKRTKVRRCYVSKREQVDQVLEKLQERKGRVF
jgi:predicted nucleic-acid-binding Zn-ribbon protein